MTLYISQQDIVIINARSIERQTIRRKDSQRIFMEINRLNWTKTIPIEKGYYFSGFADGEGSFNVSIRQKPDHQIGWQICLTFNVSQKEKYILEQFQKLLGCGRLQKRIDGVYYYIVSNPLSIQQRIIPFFERFSFMSKRKKQNFSIFCKIVNLVMEKKHLSKEGLIKIMKLREILNLGRGRKRKYALDDIETFFSENPQRLHVRSRVFREETRG